MKIFKAIKKKLKIKNSTGLKLDDETVINLFKTLGLDIDNIGNSSELSETIYFICVKHMSETISKMPWEKRRITQLKGKEKDFNNELDLILNLKPNPYYSAATFWASVELNRLHYGNSYAYIESDHNGKVKHLWLLPSDQIEIWMDDKGIIGTQNSIWYVWTNPKTNKKYTFLKDEILHFKTHTSFDGLSGVPIKKILKTQINTGKNSIAFLNKLYKNNMIGSKVLVHYTGELDPKFEDNLAKTLHRFSTAKGGGTFLPLPMGMEAKLLDMKLADAQFFENNKVSALQLAAAFGIKPNIINDYTKSSYKNSETQQIDFYVNTLQPLFKSYEQEISAKLLTPNDLKNGIRLEINERTLFKMDSTTKAEFYSKLVMNFMMTPNEAREYMDLPYMEGGDVLIGNGNAIGLKDIGNQYKKGGDK